MKKIAAILIAVLSVGCSTPEQKEKWKAAAAVAAVGLVVLAAARGGAGGGGNNAVANDYDWDWDLFFNSGHYQWACRGLQSGRFAEEYHCATKPKVDHWPGN